MEYFYAVMQLFAGLGGFLIGFKILSENTEKLADNGLRNLFNRANKNPLTGVGIGVVSTAIVQSSSATTVMVVGFVNAGVMTLTQATAIIMGANIGTTVTGQIAALQSFDFIAVAMALTFVGVVMDMAFKKDRVKTAGLMLAGLGLVFMGLKFMSAAMKIFRDSAAIVQAFSSISNPVALLLIGALVTAIVQSSSAVTAIVISMAGAGIIIGGGGNAVYFVILGTNIGTCVTALLSSVAANANGKRAAFIHLMFNVFGSVIFFILLLFWQNFAVVTFEKWFTGQPSIQIAMFHTFFNVACTLIFVPFIKVFVKISEKVIKDRSLPTVERQTYLDERFLVSPSLALLQVTKELEYMCGIAVGALEKATKGFVAQDLIYQEEIKKDNVIVARINLAIIDYLVEVSNRELSLTDETLVSRYHHVVADIMRISELAENIARYTVNSIKRNLQFSDEVKSEILNMLEKIKTLYTDTMNVMCNRKNQNMPEIDKLEDEIDALRKKLMEDHIARLNEGKCKAESSGVFINLVCNLERASDHLYYVANSGKIEKDKKNNEKNA
ncbi:MAG TPA: Na/Pi cotransporter family protein [Eubacteriales bacterium]|nr:Na/Pi cotransporter family protein [Eubacteriales bacterium]